MRRSSIVLLVICSFLLVYLIVVYAGLRGQSTPDLTEDEAQKLLYRLADAFESESEGGVLSFVAPNAKVAGRQLEDARKLLRKAFINMRNPQVEFQNVKYTRKAEAVLLQFLPKVSDETGGGNSAIVYNQPVTFTLQRIETPHLFGLFTFYEWKITNVDAPALPIE